MNIAVANKNKINKILMDSIMIIAFVLYISPVFIIINVAFKTQAESVATEFYILPEKVQLINLVKVFRESQLARSLANSIKIASASVVICITLTSMASYIIERRKTIFAGGLYFYFIISLFIPGEATLLTVMRLMRIYRLYGHIWGLSILYTAGCITGAVYLFCAYIRAIPRELDEAALIDGAGMFRFFWTILFPLMKPVIATELILIGINIYNDLLIPLVILSTKAGRTVTLEILSFTSKFSNNYPLAFSGIIIASIPVLIVFFLAQKYVVSGITAGIVKG